MPKDQPESAPAMVALDSPEFASVVAAAVRAALPEAVAAAVAAMPAPLAVAMQTPPVIQQTSIDTSKPGPDDIIVRFRQFRRFNGTAYQNQQEAGFYRHAKGLRELFQAGVVEMVHDPRGLGPAGEPLARRVA